MSKVELKQNELIELFEEQIDLLRSHCQNYDQGKITIYKDIAVKLRLLLRETRNQKSLFKQLGIDKILFINSGKLIDENNLIPTCSLLVINSPSCTISDISFFSSAKTLTNENFYVADFSDGNFTYAPCYDKHISNEVFDEWWQKQIIITDINQNKFSREQIVLSIADTYGGAHIDPNIKEPFYNIINNNSIGINIEDKSIGSFSNAKSITLTLIGQSNDSIEEPINSPIPPTIRQIAEEVILTVESRIKIIKEANIASISFIETKTKRELQYDYDSNFKFGMPSTIENFQKIVDNYFSLRRPDDVKTIYKELRNKKISLNKLINCYLKYIEKFKKEEIEIFGYSGNGWSLQGIINNIISKIKSK